VQSLRRYSSAIEGDIGIPVVSSAAPHSSWAAESAPRLGSCLASCFMNPPQGLTVPKIDGQHITSTCVQPGRSAGAPPAGRPVRPKHTLGQDLTLAAATGKKIARRKLTAPTLALTVALSVCAACAAPRPASAPVPTPTSPRRTAVARSSIPSQLSASPRPRTAAAASSTARLVPTGAPNRSSMSPSSLTDRKTPLIACASDRDGDWEIFVMSPDGTDELRLTHIARDDRSPDWSPDGTLIAFTSNRDSDDEVYVMKADGTGQRRLSHDVASCWWPT